MQAEKWDQQLGSDGEAATVHFSSLPLAVRHRESGEGGGREVGRSKGGTEQVCRYA